MAYLLPPFFALLLVNNTYTNTRDDRLASIGGLYDWEGQEREVVSLLVYEWGARTTRSV